jgi:palmitoyltransferase
MQIARNTTTNEVANWTRYKYLHDEDGTFNNPFDKGCRQNCAEAMCGRDSAPALRLHGEAIESTSLLRMEQGQLQHVNGHRY